MCKSAVPLKNIITRGYPIFKDIPFCIDQLGACVLYILAVEVIIH